PPPMGTLRAPSKLILLPKTNTNDEYYYKNEGVIVLGIYLNCEACVSTVLKALIGFDGVKSAKPDMDASTMTVKGTVDPKDLIAFIYKKTRKRAEVVTPKKQKDQNQNQNDGKEKKKQKDQKNQNQNDGKEKKKQKDQNENQNDGKEKKKQKDQNQNQNDGTEKKKQKDPNQNQNDGKEKKKQKDHNQNQNDGKEKDSKKKEEKDSENKDERTIGLSYPYDPRGKELIWRLVEASDTFLFSLES
nr:heavy metal-associated isoprenylated plant protein 3-like [Tanacetum cinerariifolium]